MHGLGYLHNDNLQIGDEVVMSVVREGENYSIPTCPIVITKAKPTATYPTLDVYPTQAPRHAPVVTLQSEQDGSYSIYSSTGTLIETGTFSQGAQQAHAACSQRYMVHPHPDNVRADGYP